MKKKIIILIIALITLLSLFMVLGASGRDEQPANQDPLGILEFVEDPQFNKDQTTNDSQASQSPATSNTAPVVNSVAPSACLKSC